MIVRGASRQKATGEFFFWSKLRIQVPADGFSFLFSFSFRNKCASRPSIDICLEFFLCAKNARPVIFFVPPK